MTKPEQAMQSRWTVISLPSRLRGQRAAVRQRLRSVAEDLLVMPLRQYFLWVGSTLFMALFLADWWIPGSAADFHSAITLSERVHLRIRSDHKWPERIVFDTAHAGMSLSTALESKLDTISNQDLAQIKQRSARDAFAAMDEAKVAPTATNDKASAIRAKPRPLGTHMTSTAAFD
ncbi:hypothetical protein PMN64_25645 [Bradyrhizobium sp. UFLA01-814]|uniref:hypothetical protein n=1 Tax=Bradyrhizobium sp. UFLA01-814 TaxID=3023480 RepID=UPI00398B29C9